MWFVLNLKFELNVITILFYRGFMRISIEIEKITKLFIKFTQII